MKRLLFVMHHYAESSDRNQQYYSARTGKRKERIFSLSECICSIWQTFGGLRFETTYRNDKPIFRRIPSRYSPEVVVCVHQDKHILDELTIPSELYRVVRVENDMNSLLLGFACQKIIAQLTQKFDFFCHIEDDLVFSDSLFFDKLDWFNSQQFDFDPLLVPNRFESKNGKKCFIDGNAGNITHGFQSQGPKELKFEFLSNQVSFMKPDNVYSGSYFLNQKQLDKILVEGHYQITDCSWIGPLESSMCLSLLKTFTIYKPELSSGFLETRHYGDRYVGTI